MFRKREASVYEELVEETASTVALLEPSVTREPVAVAPVMERAKDAITPMECDLDYYELSNELSRLTREQHGLLGIESVAREALAARITEVKGDFVKVKAFERVGGEVKRLSPEVLSWRKKEAIWHNGMAIPVPEVAVFHLDSAVFRIGTDGWSSIGVVDPSLPTVLKNRFGDVMAAVTSLDSSSSYRRAHAIYATFSGLIPSETKAKIREAQATKVFSDIRLIAEAEYDLDVQPHPRLADPIVVGLVNDEMWVIDVFDPTPLEDYIAQEFTA